MRILVIGFVAFAIWSAISTYIYVCKIKGLCYEPISMQIGVVDTVSKPIVHQEAAIPKDRVIYFAFDKSNFASDSETDKYFGESKTFLDQNLQARLSITGYTDAIGTDEYNQALGYRRAQTMQHYFESKGMVADKIIIESMGEKEPADVNNTKAGRANNRRSVITIKK